MDLKNVLEKLDPENDKHWTKDGAPRLDVMSELAGVEVTRQMVMEADPMFTRESALVAESVENPSQDGDTGFKPNESVENPSQDGELSEDEVFLKLENQIREQQIKIDEANSKVDEAKKEAAAAVAEMDTLQKQLGEKQKSKHSFSEFRRHLDRQAQIRADRAAMYERAKEATMGLPIANKSPLDQAMSRKNTRGTNRPTIKV